MWALLLNFELLIENFNPSLCFENINLNKLSHVFKRLFTPTLQFISDLSIRVYPLINYIVFYFILFSHKLRHLRSSQSSWNASSAIGNFLGNICLFRNQRGLRWFPLHHFPRNEKFNAFRRWAWNDNWGKERCQKSHFLSFQIQSFGSIFQWKIISKYLIFAQFLWMEISWLQFFFYPLNCLGFRAILWETGRLSVTRNTYHAWHRHCRWIVYR